MIFKDRHEAGQKLAEALKKYRNQEDVIVLGIPRGGVEVAFNIAKTLKVQLSIIVTKKIGHPNEPEFAIGAVSPGGHYDLDEGYRTEAGKEYIKNTVRELTKEINRRYKQYANGKISNLKDKIVILVDDGLATGFTMLSAVEYARSQKPKKVIVAVPVSSQDSYERVKEKADEVICLHTPIFFSAVGAFYQDFSQLEDDEVKFYLKEAKKYL